MMSDEVVFQVRQYPGRKTMLHLVAKLKDGNLKIMHMELS